MASRRGLLITALATLTGCSEVTTPPDNETTPGITPAPLPTTQSSHPVVSTSGIKSPNALADAHAGILNTSYTVKVTQTVRTEHGTFVIRRVLTARVGDGGAYHAELKVAGPLVADLIDTPQARSEFWSDGDRLLRAYSTGNQTRYDPNAPSYDPTIVLAGNLEYWITMILINQPPRGDIYRLFSTAETQVRDTVDSGNRKQYIIDSSAITNESRLNRVISVGSPTTIDFRAVVTPHGLVREYRLEYATRRGPKTEQVVRTVKFSAIGETEITRPPWYNAAIADSSQASGPGD